ncbi:hypothetical protein ATCV1_z464L [Acanthocystis turfacea chlorella virus 1]|uniref:Uncharacterized protein z464L n=1 Tax=Chlorovirus heliozoae TaxID=322019 RepID=A7K974_9PHYC|nr:hypothetical protein ATCV1_z464L [Acanthocystis turfacea chlorella virus 1]ABT16598.1 hypothetical protein ATCV1_z464L [Acanthocystis turfacea chlorella virus 1]
MLSKRRILISVNTHYELLLVAQTEGVHEAHRKVVVFAHIQLSHGNWEDELSRGVLLENGSGRYERCCYCAKVIILHSNHRNDVCLV